MALTTESVKRALTDFVDNKILTAVGENTALKWAIGGVSTIGLARLEEIVQQYRPLMTAMGFIDEAGNFKLQAIEQFLNASFQKQESFSMPLLGVPFRFDKTDGLYLIEALKRHGGV